MTGLQAFVALAQVPLDRRRGMPSFIELRSGGTVRKLDLWPLLTAAAAELSGLLADATTHDQLDRAVASGLRMLVSGKIDDQAWGDVARRIARESQHRDRQLQSVASSMN